jgi:hypothetical protein
MAGRRPSRTCESFRNRSSAAYFPLTCREQDPASETYVKGQKPDAAGPTPDFQTERSEQLIADALSLKRVHFEEVTMFSRRIDTVVVGGGQAGLALSYYLSREGRGHVVLERESAVANA